MKAKAVRRKKDKATGSNKDDATIIVAPICTETGEVVRKPCTEAIPHSTVKLANTEHLSMATGNLTHAEHRLVTALTCELTEQKPEVHGKEVEEKAPKVVDNTTTNGMVSTEKGSLIRGFQVTETI